MKKSLFLWALLSLILLNACQKDQTDTVDITQYSWKLKTIIIDGKKEKVKNDEYFRKDAYILTLGDNSFHISTSVNSAGGNCQIIQKGNIEIYNYGEYTEVCCHNEYDEILLQYLTSVTSYQVFNNILIFKGNQCEFKFQKE